MDYSGSCSQPAQVFAVCDGMGGETSGELAAEMAVDTLQKYDAEHWYNRWRDYILDANERICRYQESCHATVGTTFAGLVLDEDRGCAVNVGDSRIYLLRDGELRQLSRDHTEFQTMVEAGVLKQEDFARSNAHNRLTQHLGIAPEEMQLEPNAVYLDTLLEGDIFLICSDGLYGAVPDEQLCEVLCGAERLDAACKALVELAAAQGSRDNITAVLISVSPGKKRPKRAANPRHRTQGRRAVFLLTALLIAGLLLAAVGGLWLFPTVPDVVSMEKSAAGTQMEAQGFRVLEEQSYSDTGKKGTVLEQSRPGGSRARRGTEIQLTVSLGQKRVLLPETTGQAYETVSRQLEAAGFEVDTAWEYSDAAEAGTILAQTPTGGREVVAGSRVKLTVSRGPEQSAAESSEQSQEAAPQTEEGPDSERAQAEAGSSEMDSEAGEQQSNGIEEKSEKPEATGREAGEAP